MPVNHTKILLFLAAVTFLTGCSSNDEASPTAPTSPRLVKTVVVEKLTDGNVRRYPGTVVAGRRVDLAFHVSGPLIEFPVAEGNMVKEGQLLARIDPQDYQLILEAKEATLLRAKQDFERASVLIKSGSIAKIYYDETQASYYVAKADASTASKALQDTYLYAPFSGVVAKTYVENFQNLAAKEKILSLQDISEVEIKVFFPEQDMLRLNPVRFMDNINNSEIFINDAIEFDALPGRRFSAKIKKFSTEAEPNTQTYAITLAMATPDDLNVLPGMTATFILSGQNLPNNAVLLVPLSAVSTNANGESVVWVVNTDSMTVQPKIVELSGLSGKYVQILNGIDAGDRIVTAGANYLLPGMSVRFTD